MFWWICLLWLILCKVLVDLVVCAIKIAWNLIFRWGYWVTFESLVWGGRGSTSNAEKKCVGRFSANSNISEAQIFGVERTFPLFAFDISENGHWQLTYTKINSRTWVNFLRLFSLSKILFSALKNKKKIICVNMLIELPITHTSIVILYLVVTFLFRLIGSIENCCRVMFRFCSTRARDGPDSGIAFPANAVRAFRGIHPPELDWQDVAHRSPAPRARYDRTTLPPANVSHLATAFYLTINSTTPHNTNKHP